MGMLMMGDMNWHAHAGIFTYPIKIAVQLKIPLIIWGEHGRTELGGMHNFKEAKLDGWKINFAETGVKKAYIVSNRNLSQRTSYVSDVIQAEVSTAAINDINSESDWLHVCYIDDIECYNKIQNVNIKYSLDFCTDTPRESFSDVINNAEVVFDSMERKCLYKNKNFFTPIVLHSERGTEVLVNNEVVSRESMVPLSGLDVNGAGDIFAAKFIENYDNFNLAKVARIAMLETTKILIKRKNKK